jgi:hypothetical protein
MGRIKTLYRVGEAPQLDRQVKLMFAFVIMVAVAAFVPYVATPAVQHAVTSRTATQQPQQSQDTSGAPAQTTAATAAPTDTVSALPAQ